MKKTGKLLITVILAIPAHAAMAGSTDWYAGMGAGQAHYHDWASNADISGVLDAYGTELGITGFDGSRSSDADDRDTGFRLFGGYSFSPYIAAELSYLDMGEADARGRLSGTFYDQASNTLSGDISASVRATVNALTLDARFRYPLTAVVALTARAGVYGAHTKLKVRTGGSLSSGHISTSRADDSTGFHYGVGATFSVTDRLTLHTEWERLDQVVANGSEMDVDLLSAALAFHF